MNAKKIAINDLNNEQLSWMVAKHVFPNDHCVKNPAAAVGGFGYDMAEPGDETLCFADKLMDQYKISTLWRPWQGECGQWWACVEQDPTDDTVMGYFGDTRYQAAMRALLAHLEAIEGFDVAGGVDVPEVLL